MPTTSSRPRVLTVAGSDTSCGAGIQADLKTISACGAYALTAITALTAQNPDGVQGMWPVAADPFAVQLTAALAYRPAAIKVGMLGNGTVVNALADVLTEQPGIPVVLDTIIRSTSGASLLDTEGVQLLRDRLLPLATVITPNRAEARELLGSDDEKDLQAWSREHGIAVLLTGGDSHPAPAGEPRFCTDILFSAGNIEHYTLPRVETSNDHGTGCTLTAAIASFLAHGFPLPEAVQHARHFVHLALQAAAQQDWPGRGPLEHFFAFGSHTAPENTP